MTAFKRNNGQTITDPITLVVGDKLRLKLDGVPKNAATVIHFVIQSDVADALEISQNPKASQREQTITLTAKKTATLVNVKAYHADGKAADCTDTAKCVPTLQIKIVDKIALPAESTDAGALARLLLAESRTPDYPSYGDGQDVLKAMGWMRLVIENRMNVKSSYLRGFGIQTQTIRGVITSAVGGGEQFEGFKNYPAIGPDQGDTIENCLRLANNGTHPRFEKYRAHVQRAIDVANGTYTPDADFSKNGLYGWMTNDGRSHPGGSFVSAPDLVLGGQQFFTVQDGYFK